MSFIVEATVYTTLSDGSWTTGANWNPSAPPTAGITGHTLNISHNINTAAGAISFASGTTAITFGANRTVAVGNISLASGAIVDQSGTGSVTAATVVIVGATYTVRTGSTFTVSGSLTLRDGGRLVVESGATVQITGAFVTDAAANSMDIAGTVTAGSFNNTSYQAQTFTGAGSISVSGNFGITNTGAGIAFSPSITVGGNLNAGAFGPVVFSRAVSVTGTFDQVSGNSITLNSTLNAGAINSAGGTGMIMNGVTTVVGNVVVSNGGTFTVNNAMTLNNLSNLQGSDIFVNAAMTLNNYDVECGSTLTGTGTFNYTSLTPFGVAPVCGVPGLCTATASTSLPASANLNLNTCTAILPIELAAFTVGIFENNYLVNWTTYTETNNDYFQIEYSLDGVNFYYLATEKGSGNTRSLKSYEIQIPYFEIDQSVIYFRLKQVDYDGTSSYSSIVSLELNKQFFEVYPNPNTGQFQINYWLKGENVDELEVYIMDVLSNELFSKKAYFNKNIADLNFTNLNPGTYLLLIPEINIQRRIIIH